MLYLIRRDQRDAKSANLADWTENLNAVYFYEPGTSQVCIETFKNAFSLFPIIRDVERDARLHPDDNSETIAIFSALITDRGLLAEQTRDAAMYVNQSRISTVLTYTPKPIAKERHKRCVNEALMRVQPLWKGYFQNRSGYDRFGTLLDIFYLQCVHGQKTIGSSVRFPCKCFLDCERKRFKNIQTCLCQQCSFERKRR